MSMSGCVAVADTTKGLKSMPSLQEPPFFEMIYILTSTLLDSFIVTQLLSSLKMASRVLRSLKVN